MTIASDLAGAAVGTVVSPLKYVKIVFLTIAGVAFIALAVGCYWLYGQVQSANQKNGQLTEQVRTLSQDLALVKVGQSAMNLGQLLSDQQKEDMDKQVRATRNKLKTREIEIDKTIKDPEEKVRLKSEARMESVWELFCHIQPTNAICQQRVATEKAGAQDKEANPQGAVK